MAFERQALDAALSAAVEMGIPGVVALATRRRGVVYEGAAGVRRLGAPEPMTADTALTLWSCTKPITAAAALQAWERGRLDFDAPAKLYAPHIADIEVFDGYDADGAAKFRPPKRDITTRMLLTHTAGFSYEFFNADYQRLRRLGEARPLLKLPLVRDPGEQWEYGYSMDWLGQVVEGAFGRSLDDVFTDNLFAPLGMTSTGFTLPPEAESRRGAMHEFGPDGRLVATPVKPLKRPDVCMGGGGLHGSGADFLRFLKMWLDEGGGALKPESIAYAERNHLQGLDIRTLRSIDPARSLDFEFFPGTPKSWALSFLRLEADAPTGRAAGSLSWAGLGNLYFWIDRRNDVAGFWAAQYLPFLHPWATAGFEAFERAVYDALRT